MTNPLDESAVPLILDEPKHGRVGGISMMIRFTTRDNGMAARDISRMFGGLLARIGEYGKGNTLGKA